MKEFKCECGCKEFIVHYRLIISKLGAESRPETIKCVDCEKTYKKGDVRF